MISLSNNIISIAISEKGAELQSIFNKQSNLEYLWSGDAKFWGKKSPVLFPIVGGLKDNSYTYKEQLYTLGRHGFARDKNFVVKEQLPAFVILSLTDDKETLQQYPFHFIFSIKYTLVENTIQVTYIVENTGDKELLFSVGGHPAFKVPLIENTSYEDYHLRFEKAEIAGRYPLTAEGLIENTTVPVLTGTNKLPLKKELFNEDALVFKELQSHCITIASDKTPHGLSISFNGFPYLGIWAAKGADFVCIEPWCGIADTVSASGKLEEKEGIQKLKPLEVFEKAFSIEVF